MGTIGYTCKQMNRYYFVLLSLLSLVNDFVVTPYVTFHRSYIMDEVYVKSLIFWGTPDVMIIVETKYLFL